MLSMDMPTIYGSQPRKLYPISYLRMATLTGFEPVLRNRSLIPNPLHVLDEQLLSATVVKFCGAAVSVPGDALGNL